MGQLGLIKARAPNKLVRGEEARGPCSKVRKHTARLGYTANCLRTAAAELLTLSTALCNSSFVIWRTKGLAPISYFIVLRIPSQSVAPLCRL